MHTALRSAAFLGRSLLSDVLSRLAIRVRPFVPDVTDDAPAVGKRAGDVTLSAEAERMIREGAEPPSPRVDEHAPEVPLKGSLRARAVGAGR